MGKMQDGHSSKWFDELIMLKNSGFADDSFHFLQNNWC